MDVEGTIKERDPTSRRTVVVEVENYEPGLSRKTLEGNVWICVNP